LIKMRCEFKYSLVNDVKNKLSDFETRRKALGLQIFSIQSDLESVENKLLNAVKIHMRERLLLERANLESALDCKQQLLDDANVVIADLKVKLPDIEKLLFQNRWIKALNCLNAESVD